MAKRSPAQDLPRFQVRMEDALHQKLLEAAYKADRSLNAEIIARLERSFGETPETIDKEWVEEFVQTEIEKAVAKMLPDFTMGAEEIKAFLDRKGEKR